MLSKYLSGGLTTQRPFQAVSLSELMKQRLSAASKRPSQGPRLHPFPGLCCIQGSLIMLCDMVNLARTHGSEVGQPARVLARFKDAI